MTMGYDEDDRWDGYDDDDYEDRPRIQFARPGSGSALRAATKDDPRVWPCPTCDAPNRLTRQDKMLGYQCDRCADRAERGYD